MSSRPTGDRSLQGSSESGVHRFAFEGEDAEDAFVDAAEGLAADVRRLRQDGPLRAKLSDAARERAAARIDTPIVVGRITQLYDELVAGRPR